MQKIFFLTLFILTFSLSFGQQVPDDSYDPEIKNPAYDRGKGPIVFLDEAHENFHTADNRYRPFVKLLENDGYVIKPSTLKISRDVLQQCSIFVISVPMSKDKKSAYTREEIRILRDWVSDGGSLLLITDHMPDVPAIADLASAFGIELLNGYVLNEAPGEDVGPIFFKRSDGTLTEHPITLGRIEYDEKINSVTSFTGCAFKADTDFYPLMIFGSFKISWMTKEADKFPPDTPKINVEGWYQGGVMEIGEGRMAFFGEAGMFTAQIIKRRNIKFGMNVPFAKENHQFLLNIFHWLSGIL
ncbi:hypothetical protein ACFL4T_06035 [candidate division KSB1 bacterium]